MNTNATATGLDANPVPVPYYRSTARKTFVWIANATMLVYFVVLAALGIEYITGLAFGACVLAMCYLAAFLIFFKRGYLKFIAPVADFHAGVLNNRLFGRKAPKTDKESLSLGHAAFLEEISSGIWNPKFFWQSVIYVDLKRHLPIGGKEGTAYTSDQVETYYLWFGTVRAVQGYCGTMVRIGEEAAVRAAEGLTDAAVAEMINTVGYKQLPSQQTSLAERLRKYYDGDGTMSEKEADMALAVERLVLRQIRRSKQVQDSAELVERGKNLAAAVEALVSRDKSLTTKQAVDRILMEAGKGDLRVYEGLDFQKDVLFEVTDHEKKSSK